MTLCGVKIYIVWMTIWNIEKQSKSLYRSIPEIIERELENGSLNPGDKLPTHRDLADLLGINVSTVTKGYKEAEKRGLITGTTGKGTYVSFDAGYDVSMQHNPKVKGKKLAEFGLVTPHLGIEPDIETSLKKIAKTRDLITFLDYNHPSGLHENRRAGALWAKKYGMGAEAKDVVICAGAQHTLNCALMSCFSVGDRIAVSNLTYPGIKSLSKMLGIILTGIPMDEEGMTKEGLETACKRENIKGLFLMPGVQNPTTSCMSQKRRGEIASVIKRYDLILIEDDAYALTLEKVLPPISSLVPESSIFIAGVSKILGAGLRIAYAIALNPKIRKNLSSAVLNTIWMAPPLNSALISLWIFDGTCDKVMKLKRDEAIKRYNLAKRILSGYKIKGHKTGFFIWVELPDHWTGIAFEDSAKSMGLNVFCSEKFITGDLKVKPAIRVALTCGESVEILEKHLITLRKVLDGDVREDSVVF